MSEVANSATGDDEKLLERLRVALAGQDPVPAHAVEFAVGAFAWRNIDADLAELLHDSDEAGMVAVRDSTAVRVLMFRAGGITLEAEQRRHDLLGALSPAGRYRVQVYDGGREPAHPAVASVVSDDAGLFRVGDLRGTFRFVVASADDEVVLVSPWVTS